MLTVLLECHNNEPELAHTLAVLVSGAVDGLISDVVVLDNGSADGSSRVADAAGARFVQGWDLRDVLEKARGEWLMLLEPGARPQSGWIEEVLEHASISRSSARFSPSRKFPRPLLKRFARRGALELGFVMPKGEAVKIARPGMGLSALARGASARKLAAELIPAGAIKRGQ